MRDSKKTCLIIPCYNEEKRLNIEEFKKHCSDDLIFVFVNDGSSDGTFNLLKSHGDINWHIVDLNENKGKSEAIRQGALYAKDQQFFHHIEWLGFWDSDLSVPLQELGNYFIYAQSFAPDTDCIIGSRVKRMGSNIIRSAFRHYLGRCFCTFVSFLFSMSYYDTQCGAKILRKGLVNSCFSEPFHSNWVFDIELLLRIRSYKVVEYPLQVWKEKSGSKINFVTVWFEVMRDLLRIRQMLK